MWGNCERWRKSEKMTENDFTLLGKFKGDTIEFMEFDIKLHQLLNKYNILWKEIQYPNKHFTEDELKR